MTSNKADNNDTPHYICANCLRERGYLWPPPGDVGTHTTRCASCGAMAYCFMYEDLTHIGDTINVEHHGKRKK